MVNLANHKFQFISCLRVYHEHGCATSKDKININLDSHLLHICNGYGTINIDKNKDIKLQPGSVVSIPRKTPFTMKLGDGFEMLNIHYQVWIEDDSYLNDRFRLPFVMCPDFFKVCERKLRKSINLPNNNFGILQKSALIYDVVSRYLGAFELIKIDEGVIDERIGLVAEYLKSESCNNFDSEKISRISCLSNSQLNRKFKQYFNMSPHQYWEKQVLLKVCIDIEQTSKTFMEIARDFNFSSSYYFSRWFKKKMECSPSFFRANQNKL